MAIAIQVINQPKEEPPFVVALTGLPNPPGTKFLTRFATNQQANQWINQAKQAIKQQGGIKTLLRQLRDGSVDYQGVLDQLPNIIGGVKIVVDFPTQAELDAWIAQVNPGLLGL